MTFVKLSAVQTVYVLKLSRGQPARSAFITLYGYGARRTRKRSVGRLETARTTRFSERECARQVVIELCNEGSEREMAKTKRAPASAEK